MSHRFFAPRSSNSSYGHLASSSHTGSQGHMPSVEMSAPHSSQVTDPQLRAMLPTSSHMEIQHVTKTEQEHLHQLGSLDHKPPVGTESYLARCMGPSQRNPPMLQPYYSRDGNERMRGFARESNILHNGNQSKNMPNRLAMMEHSLSNITAAYNHEMLKRKAVSTELQLGSSTYSIVDLTNNENIGFIKTPEDAVQMRTAKKKKTMSLSLFNEEDENNYADVERFAREIPLFPQHLAHALPNSKSEFAVYKWSTSSAGEIDVTLDLSLQLSSSSGGSSAAMDHSLKLKNSGT